MLCPWDCAEPSNGLSSLNLTRALCHMSYEDTRFTDEETEVQRPFGDLPSITQQLGSGACTGNPTDRS